MKKHLANALPPFALLLGALLLIATGCSSNKTPWCYYFQRAPIRVLIMPSTNRTEHPDASIIFNQACQAALEKKGFEVISADKVVAYASAEGLLLRDIAEFKASRIGRDLGADMVLYSDINTWESTYVLLNTQVTVAGTSRLMETTTDALIWNFTWTLKKDSNSGNNNGLIGMLVGAAVDAVANSMFDAVTGLGQQAATATVDSLPQPGFAPKGSMPKSTPH
ncbi:GNA1162 family protein [Pontiella sp.]|uniref:GNA1162 family protein n=1 Tax=Pontiella sp. TaxID=2837462 RepID=UPI003566BC34